MDNIEEYAVTCLYRYCAFLPGSWDKRFVRSLYDQLEKDKDKPLTLKQKEELWRIHLSYRKQLSTACQEVDMVGNWCKANGYTDPFKELNKWWAFAPNAVMPVPISDQIIVKWLLDLREFCRNS